MILNATEGTRSEYLAYFAMSCIGYVTPVPRQSDVFGVDCFVYLATPHGKFLKPTGPAVAVQIKSNKDPIRLKTIASRNAFFRLATPFFVAVVDRTGRSLDLFQTTWRQAYARVTGAHELELVPGPEPSRFKNKPRARRWKYYLGKPAWSGSLDHLDGPNKKAMRGSLRKTVEFWAEIDSINSALLGLELPAAVKAESQPAGPLRLAEFPFKEFVGPALAEGAMLALGNVAGVMHRYLNASLSQSPQTKTIIGEARMMALKNLLAAAAQRARTPDAGA